MKHPTATWILGNVHAMMWGCPQDWRTAPLNQEGDQGKALEVVSLVGAIAVQHKLNRVLSPTVSDFSSRFLDDSEQSPWQLTLPGTACKLHRGLRGDGFEIHPGDAGIIAPADCAVVVVTTPSGRVLLLHAGRDSLVDRKLIETGNPSKQHESIIFAAWNELQVRAQDATGSKWFILPSVSAGAHFRHSWEDADHGDKNKGLVSYLVRKYDHTVKGHPKFGMIDVPAIIAAQLTQFCGLDPDNITVDTRCTYTEVDTGGEYVWHSHRRAVNTGGDPLARNLVVVVNTES